MQDIVISVIMPIYKANHNFLKKAIDSLLQQTFKKFEIIIVEDPSEHIAKDFFDSYYHERIKYFLNPKRTSLVQQLNLAILKSKGYYLARADADDISAKTRLERQFDFLEHNSRYAAVGSNLIVIDENDNITGYRNYPIKDKEIIRTLYIRNPLAHPSSMIRKEVLEKIGGYREGFPHAEDYELWTRMVANGYKIINQKEYLLYYRHHGSASKFKHQKKQILSSIKLKLKFFYNYKNEYKRYMFIGFLRILCEILLFLFPVNFVFNAFEEIYISKKPLE